MPDMDIWILLGTGLFSGFMGAMLGVGGGFIIVPILSIVLCMPMQAAIGSSLIAIIINSSTATIFYIRNHIANLKLGLYLSLMLVPGAIAGGLIASALSSPTLSIIFSVVLIYVAYTFFPHKKPKPTREGIAAQQAINEKEHSSHAWLDGCYFDPAVKEEINYSVHHPLTGLFTSFLGGMASSLLGIGGGVINVPVMNRIMRVPIKAAIATSSLMLGITTMTGSLIYIHNGYINPFTVAPLILGIFAGARLGATFAHRIEGTTLIRIFSIFLLSMALIMLVKTLITLVSA